MSRTKAPIHMDVPAGSTIHGAILRAIDLANSQETTVYFVFGTIEMAAKPGDTFQDVSKPFDASQRQKLLLWEARDKVNPVALELLEILVELVGYHQRGELIPVDGEIWERSKDLIERVTGAKGGTQC